MRATIKSTSAITEMKDPKGRPYACRVWEGETEAGVKFTAYIGMVQVSSKDDNAEFEMDLAESTPPRADTIRVMDMRFFID
jgi:hypothetical protein